jgi:hypothetical protein
MPISGIDAFLFKTVRAFSWHYGISYILSHHSSRYKPREKQSLVHGKFFFLGDIFSLEDTGKYGYRKISEFFHTSLFK